MSVVRTRGWCEQSLEDVLRKYAFGRDSHGVLIDHVSKIEGNFAGYYVDRDGKLACIVTDAAGSIPVYCKWTGEKWVIGWRAWDVALTGFSDARLDPASVGDFILNETVCFPNSLFAGVHVAAPGAVTYLSPSGRQEFIYYEPSENSDRENLRDVAEDLSSNFKSAVLGGLSGCNTAIVLFSGGEDARTAVSQVPDDISVRLVCFSDAHNRETRLAHRAASSLGYDVDTIIRPEGFYRHHIKDRVEAIGGGFDVRHTHVFGSLAEEVRCADAILGGYAADTLFKKTWMANVSRGYGRLGPDRIRGEGQEQVGVADLSRHGLLRDPVRGEVIERRRAHHARLLRLRPQSAGNWHTLWPLGTQRVTYAHYLACLDVGPRVVEPFMDSRVFKVAARVPDEYRVDRKVVHAAFAEGMGAAGWVPTSSGRIPRFRGWPGRLIELGIYGGWSAAKYVKQAKARALGQRVVMENPWSPAHYAFLADAEEILGKERSQRMKDFMMDEVLKPRGRSFDETFEKLSLEERFRAIQVGVFL